MTSTLRNLLTLLSILLLCVSSTTTQIYGNLSIGRSWDSTGREHISFIQLSNTAHVQLSDSFSAFTLNQSRAELLRVNKISFQLNFEPVIHWKQFINNLKLFYVNLTHLSLIDCHLSLISSLILDLPTLQSLDISGNPLLCRSYFNLPIWLHVKLKSSLLSATGLPVCDLNTTSFHSSSVVQQYANANFQLPCFPDHPNVKFSDSRLSTNNNWAPVTAAVWSLTNRLPQNVVIGSMNVSSTELLPTVLNASITTPYVEYNHGLFHKHTVKIASSDSFTIAITSATIQFSGQWQCTVFIDNETYFSVYQTVQLKSHYLQMESVGYVIAGSIAVFSILCGVLVSFILKMYQTRCCSQVPHLVEAQSITNLTESPKIYKKSLMNISNLDNCSLDLEEVWFDAEEGETEGWIYRVQVDLEDGSIHELQPLLKEGNFMDRMRALPANVHLLELRGRMRDQVDSVKTRMATLSEASAKNMKVVGSSVRAGFNSSVETVKWQMKSITEFCGTAVPLNQTVSVVSIHTDPESSVPVETHLHCVTNV